VALELPNRVAVEQMMFDDTRQGFRNAMTEVACRMELATFGPPNPVAEMAAEDRPVGFRGNG
jgi:hypothetical protein